MTRPTTTDLRVAFDALLARKDIDWGDVTACDEWANLVELMNRVRERDSWKGMIVE